MIDIDIAAVRREAKARWLSEHKRKIAFLDRVEQSIPWWLVIIAGTLFILSAPHTAETFNRLTPGFGMAAPLFVEFGLLYTAFRRKKLKQRAESIPAFLYGFEVLLFIVAIGVNGAGSFTSVVSSIGLQNLSMADMLTAFGSMPATSQVALFLVPMAALMIPIGTVVAGEGLAALVLERRSQKDDTDERWAETANERLFTAFFDALVNQGITPGKARKMAYAYLGEKPENLEITDSSGLNTEREPLPKGEAKHRLQSLLQDDPQSVHYSATQLMELTGAGKSAVYEWKKEHRNGSTHD